MISLPDDLLRQVDRAAKRRRLTRSGFLQLAVRGTLGERLGREKARAADRLIGSVTGVHGPSAGVLARAERDRLDARDRARR